MFTGLIEAAGSWNSSVTKLKALSLPKLVSPILDRLEAVAAFIAKEDDNLQVTIDPVESRGLNIIVDLGSVFFTGCTGELGRGGRYILNDGDSTGSCGFTLYMETVLRALPEPFSRNRLLVPHLINRDVLKSLRRDGWITVSLFQQVDSLEKEAKRLNCSHIFSNNRPKKLG